MTEKSPPTAAAKDSSTRWLRGITTGLARRIAALEPFPVVLAALLPCFWIYLEVGKDIHARAAKPIAYQAWIETYAGEEFASAVRAVIATTDEVAARASGETVQSMHAVFTRATQLEWMFWDSAYHLAKWPV